MYDWTYQKYLEFYFSLFDQAIEAALLSSTYHADITTKGADHE